jgi:hypothetical protein
MPDFGSQRRRPGARVADASCALHSSAGQTVTEATDRGEGTAVTVAHFSKAFSYSEYRQYALALEGCRSGQRYDAIGLYGCLILETVEASAVQFSGEPMA